MRHTRHIHLLLLTSVLFVAVAGAQTKDDPLANIAPDGDQVSAARSQYVQIADISAEANDGKTLAQLPRRGPGMPFPRQRGYPRGTYATPWMDHGDAGHAAIGAAIGFGIGATLGAIHSARNGTPVGGGVLIGGSLLALFGAVIGGSHALLAPRRVYRPSWPEDDEDSDLRSHPMTKEGQTKRTSSARIEPDTPAGAETSTLRSAERLAVP